MSSSDPVLRRAAAVAAALAFGSAAVTAYWLFGGTALLDTVGGYAERLARSGGALALLAGALVILVKIAGGLLGLGLAALPRGHRLQRPLLLVAGLGSAVLVLYGGLLVAAGALVLSGVVHPDGPVDRRALTWHVYVWDMWFLLWGVALAVATARSVAARRR